MADILDFLEIDKCNNISEPGENEECSEYDKEYVNYCKLFTSLKKTEYMKKNLLELEKTQKSLLKESEKKLDQAIKNNNNIVKIMKKDFIKRQINIKKDLMLEKINAKQRIRENEKQIKNELKKEKKNFNLMFKR